MIVWMIHAVREGMDHLEGPYISKEYVFNETAWSDLVWFRKDCTTEQYIAKWSGWELCLYKVRVLGS
jgi:hypothetical protein